MKEISFEEFERLSDHQKKMILKQSPERQAFIYKQLKSFTGWMYGAMFMPSDGICYYCRHDILASEMEKGNDGSEGVTGCTKCFKSYCD